MFIILELDKNVMWKVMQHNIITDFLLSSECVTLCKNWSVLGWGILGGWLVPSVKKDLSAFICYYIFWNIRFYLPNILEYLHLQLSCFEALKSGTVAVPVYFDVQSDIMISKPAGVDR